MSYSHVQYDSVRVSYTTDLDGGGNAFGRAFLPFVQSRFGRVDSVFEWCSGPGFIGFSLLAAGLCDSLDLGDVSTDAQAAIAQTVEDSGLDGRVRFHLSDCFDQVPDELRWDLLVGNPPHVNAPAAASDYQHSHSPLIWKDTDWAIHRRFYAEAVRRLRPGGAIVIQENHRFSAPDDFTRMVEDSGLEIAESVECGPGYEDYYFLLSRLPQAAA